MNPHLSRRSFIIKTAASSAAVLCSSPPGRSLAAAPPVPPIAVFSKVYQTLNLGFDDAAAVTADAGLNGIDCPVRPGGEVLPERVTEDLPRYVEALRKRGLQMPLLTSAITSVSSPHAEDVLRAAKRAGVQFYRLGFIDRQKSDVAAQIREIKAQLKDLAAMNKEIGIGALVQNHSPSGHTYIGGDLTELREIVEGFSPEQIGVAFDIGHALVVHGEEWKSHFDKLQPHFKVAYIKDVRRGGRWVPFGQGDLAQSRYFKLLKEIGYHAPISMHIEFDWTDKGKSKTRAGLVAALKDSSSVLKRWLAEA